MILISIVSLNLRSCHPRPLKEKIFPYVKHIYFPPLTMTLVTRGYLTWQPLLRPSRPLSLIFPYFPRWNGPDLWSTNSNNVQSYLAAILAQRVLQQKNYINHNCNDDSIQWLFSGKILDWWVTKSVSGVTNRLKRSVTFIASLCRADISFCQ